MRYTKHLEIGCLIAFSLLLSIACTTMRADNNQVRGLLEGREWTLEPARFQKLKGAPEEALMQIVADTKAPNYLQFRALTALQLYPKESVVIFLENYLTTQSRAFHLRRALDTFVKINTPSQPQRVETAATPFLEHADPHLRVIAARALKSLKRPSAQERLEGYLQQESQEWILQAIQKE